MSKNNKLTPVEWEIIDKIWELGGSPSIREIWEKCFPNGEKAYTTVQTIMNTLEKKGLLERKKIGLVNFYKPLKSREEAVKSEMSGVVSRIFNGSVPALANYLINYNQSYECVISNEFLVRRAEGRYNRCPS